MKSPFTRWGLIGVVASAFACGGIPQHGDGGLAIQGTTQEDHIIGGAAFSGLPGVGSILKGTFPYCTGTLIDAYHVVTAAHCFMNNATPSSYRFATGPNANSPDNVYAIQSIRMNPSFSTQTVSGDIAVVTLARAASEEPHRVLNSFDSSWVGANLLFVGYGVDDGQRQSGLGIKRAVIMPVSEVGNTQFAYETAGKNTCNGDSGGPAFFVDQKNEAILAGVTSYGDAYCTQYGVDTIVPAYLNWLGVIGAAPNSATAATDPCGGETFTGRCTGNTVTWCENNQVYQVDCSARGKTCGYSSADGYNGCLASTTTTDPCHGETYRGRCSGDTVIWCESGVVKEINCATHSGVCEYDSSRGIDNCAY